MIKRIFQTLLGLACLIGFNTSKKITFEEVNKKYKQKLGSEITNIHLKVASRILEKQYLIFQYHGKFSAELQFGSKGKLRKVCSGKRVTCIMEMSNEILALTKDYMTQISIDCQEEKGNCNGEFKAYVADYLTTGLEDYDVLFLKDVEYLYIDAKGKNLKKDKIRIMVEGVGDSLNFNLKAFGNFNKDKFPTAKSHDFDLANVYSNELADVFVKGDKYFCEKEDTCNYKLTVHCKGFRRVKLATEFTSFNENISFGRDYFDKIDKGKSAVYKLDLKKGEIGQDLLLTLIPISGDVELGVNPEVIPHYFEKSNWVMKGRLTKHIRIKAKDLKNKYQTLSRLYLIVNSKAHSTYYFRAQYIEGASTLWANIPEAGILKNNEMANYRVFLVTSKNEQNFKVEIKLSIKNGQANLYTKKCKTFKDCSIEPSVINDKEFAEKHGIEAHEENNSYKKLEYEMTCGADIYTYKAQVGEAVEYICMVAVGVYAKKTSLKQGAMYEISYINPEHHILLQSNHLTKETSLEGKRYLFRYNFNGKGENKAVKSINFDFDLNFGEIQYFISKEFSDPCIEGKHELSGVINSSKDSFKDKFYTAVYKRKKSEDNLRGTYFICVKSMKYSSYKLKPYPKENEEAENKKVQINDLPAGEQIFGEIAKEGQIVFFSISVNMAKSSNEWLILSLSPMRGQYRIFVSDNGELPNPKQRYWNTLGNHLKISTNDPNFRSRSVYYVGIQLVKSSRTQNQFTISYSYSEKHILLKPSMTVQGTLGKNRMASYRIEIPNQAKNITLLKTTKTDALRLYLSFDAKIPYPNYMNKQFLIWEREKGFWLQKKDWVKKCKNIKNGLACSLYIVAHGNNQDEEFSLSYNFDGGAFHLPDGHPVAIPFLNHKAPPLKFIFNSPKLDSPLTTSVSNRYQPIVVYTNVKERGQAPEFVYNKTKSQLTLDNYKNSGTEDFKKFKNPVFYFTVMHGFNRYMAWIEKYMSRYINIDNKNGQNPYTFSRSGDFEVSSNYLSLAPFTQKTVSLSKDEWKFFKIHNNLEGNILVNAVPFASALGYIYIKKGTEPPSITSYTARSRTYMDPQIEVNQDMMNKAVKIKGDYVIGIHAVKAGKFNIGWMTSKEKLTKVWLNWPTSLKIEAEEAQYIQVSNNGIKKDIEVIFESSKANVNLYAIPVHADRDKQGNLIKSFPSSDNFAWKATIGHAGGIGKLIIDTKNPKYCIYCEYLIAVESDSDDKIDIIAKKRSPWSFTRLFEGRRYVGNLTKMQADKYVFENSHRRSTFSFNIRVLRGNVTIFYSLSKNFEKDKAVTHEIKRHLSEDFFTIKIGKDSSFWRASKYNHFLRYFKITANRDSIYEFKLEENNRISPINFNRPAHDYVYPGGKHFYLIRMRNGEKIDINLDARRIKGIKKKDISLIGTYLSSSVKLFYTKSYLWGKMKRFNYMMKSKKESFGKALRVSTEGKDGYLVVEVKGVFSKVFYYKLEISKNDKNSMVVNKLYANDVNTGREVYYMYDTDKLGHFVNLKFNQCLGKSETYFGFRKYDQNFDKIEWKKTGDDDLTRSYKIMQNGVLYLKVKDSRPFTQKELTKKVKKHKYPSVFSFETELTTDYLKHLSSEYILDPYSIEPAVTEESSPTVSILPIGIKNMEELSKTHNIMINYTIYVSSNKKMMEFMTKCDNFDFDIAKKRFDSPLTYTRSLVEYYGKSEGLTSINLELLRKFNVQTISFGQVVHAKVVAKVSISEASVKNNL